MFSMSSWWMAIDPQRRWWWCQRCWNFFTIQLSRAHDGWQLIHRGDGDGAKGAWNFTIQSKQNNGHSCSTGWISMQAGMHNMGGVDRMIDKDTSPHTGIGGVISWRKQTRQFCAQLLSTSLTMGCIVWMMMTMCTGIVTRWRSISNEDSLEQWSGSGNHTFCAIIYNEAEDSPVFREQVERRNMLFNNLLCKQRIPRVLFFAIPQMMLIMKIQALKFLQEVAREGRRKRSKGAWFPLCHAMPCNPKGPLWNEEIAE